VRSTAVCRSRSMSAILTRVLTNMLIRNMSSKSCLRIWSEEIKGKYGGWVGGREGEKAIKMKSRREGEKVGRREAKKDEGIER
jgi:hypothetical protein